MPRSSPITVAGEIFETKEALRRRCRSILYAYKPGQKLSTPDLAFMRDLIDRHENADDKIGCGIVAMFVMPDAFGKQCFGLLRSDGSKTDFSFNSCLRKKPADADFRAACRTAIVYQIQRFRDRVFTAGTPVYCEFTHELITPSNCHVDHIPPLTFKALLDRFVAENRIAVTVVEILGNEDGSTQKRLADPILLKQWQLFHEQWATLRVVSSRANLSHIKRGSN